ncbi:outer membrane beta-barrel protein [Magnetospirillum gryphiswaldense]|nr:outer membrane beta-barrel protein [Magnetospirillum gryphiswaldense]
MMVLCNFWFASLAFGISQVAHGCRMMLLPSGRGLEGLEVMKSARGMAVGVLVLVGGLSGPALGQSASEADQKAVGQKSESVRKQKEGLLPPKEALEQKDTDIAPDAYQPKGVDLGAFLLMPKMELDVARNSNIYATNYDAKHDIISTYRPELALNSRFDRHAINALARVERKEFVTFDKESVTNGLAQLSGRYDVTDRDALNASLTYTHDHEDRGSFDDAGGLRPTEFHYLTLNGSGAFSIGNLTSSLGVTAVKRDWEDTRTSTGITPSHFRNRNELDVTLRESYEFIPGYSWVNEGTLLWRAYQHDADQFGIGRDSSGLRLGTGIGLDISELVRGDFLAGYMRQNYKDERLSDPSGYYVKARLNWSPSKLTTIIPTLERSIEETTANNVSALIRTAVSVTVRHELQRNLILGSTLSYSRDEQKGGNLEADTYEGVVRATYLFNRNLYSSLELGEKHKLTNVDGSGFNQTTAMLRLGLQY